MRLSQGPWYGKDMGKKPLATTVAKLKKKIEK